MCKLDGTPSTPKVTASNEIAANNQSANHTPASPSHIINNSQLSSAESPSELRVEKHGSICSNTSAIYDAFHLSMYVLGCMTVCAGMSWLVFWWFPIQLALRRGIYLESNLVTSCRRLLAAGGIYTVDACEHAADSTPPPPELVDVIHLLKLFSDTKTVVDKGWCTQFSGSAENAMKQVDETTYYIDRFHDFLTTLKFAFVQKQHYVPAWNLTVAFNEATYMLQSDNISSVQ